MASTKRHDRRAEALRGKIHSADIDALLVTSPINIGYLTGFTGSTAYALYIGAKLVLITDTRYAIRAREECPQGEIVIVASGGYMEGLKDVLAARPTLQKVGFESGTVTVAQYEKLKSELPAVQLVATADIVESLRLVKDEGEVALTETAIQLAEEAFLAVKDLLRPGISEAAFALELDYARILEAGDLVTVDWGASIHGYNSDMTRTFALGTEDDVLPEAQRIYQVVHEALRLAIAAIRPGKTGKEIDAVARDYIAVHGYADNFGHSLGHSLGRDVHDGPGFSIRSEKLLLAPGMIQTVEPGIYIENLGGVRIEHDIVVTEDGCLILTNLPTELEFVA
jgi:Xaa-Pro aminopeptidase